MNDWENELAAQDVSRVLGALCGKVKVGLPWRLRRKESACNAGNPGCIPGLGRFPWRREWLPTPHSSILAWRMPWIEKTGGYQGQKASIFIFYYTAAESITECQ